MIERYSLTSLDDVAERMGAALPDGCTPRFNIAALQLAPIRTAGSIVLARWGLLPPWRGHGGKRDPHVVHAPLEAIEQVPLLRNAFKNQRCLVIADGCFAWRGGSKKPQPIWLHPAAEPDQPQPRSRAIAFAGLAATHRDDSQPSFAIIVGPASPLVEPLDATMPLVVPAARYGDWLTGSRDAARSVLASAAAGEPLTGWRAEPVAPWPSLGEDSPRCVEPLGNPAQGELF